VEAAMKLEPIRLTAKVMARLLRGFAAAMRREICCPKLHFAGWR
jgi:hypothetical protein